MIRSSSTPTHVRYARTEIMTRNMLVFHRRYYKQQSMDTFIAPKWRMNKILKYCHLQILQSLTKLNSHLHIRKLEIGPNFIVWEIMIWWLKLEIVCLSRWIAFEKWLLYPKNSSSYMNVKFSLILSLRYKLLSNSIRYNDSKGHKNNTDRQHQLKYLKSIY